MATAPVYCGHNDGIRAECKAVVVRMDAKVDGPRRLFVEVSVHCEVCCRDYVFLGPWSPDCVLSAPSIRKDKGGRVLVAPLTVGSSSEGA